MVPMVAGECQRCSRGRIAMCLAIPALVVALDPNREMAVVEIDSIRKEVSTQLLDAVHVGDYVLIHVGFALQVLSATEGRKTLALFAQMNDDLNNAYV